LGPIDLSGILALRQLGSNNTLTFRIVNYEAGDPGGNWYLYDVANSSAPDLELQGAVAPVLTPIQSWRQQWFGTTSNSGPAADGFVSTSDAMPNLLKYALGLPPLVVAKNPVVGDVASGYLRLTLPKNPAATDVSYHVEVTPDLANPAWTTNGTVIDVNSSTLLQVHYNVPIGSSPVEFIRLQVTQP
jgi:hypothetical protein